VLWASQKSPKWRFSGDKGIQGVYTGLPERFAGVRLLIMMDDFEDSVTPEEQTERGGKSGLIPILIGLVGIIVGVTGIILANQAQKEVKALEARLAAAPDKTEDLQQTVAGVDERLVKLGGEFVKLGRADRQIQENTQSAFNDLGGKVSSNRDAINELSGKMTELVEKLENWKPGTRVATTSTDAGAMESASSAAPEEGVYAIQSGDTLSKVAKKFGVSLSALMAANPTVNPRALQIGQKIVIP
jgi:LysM repeat protein